MLLDLTRFFVNWSCPGIDAQLGRQSLQESDRFEEDVWDTSAQGFMQLLGRDLLDYAVLLF